jgi:hypothetical protein
MAGVSTYDWHGVHWEEDRMIERKAPRWGWSAWHGMGAGVSCGGANEWGFFVFLEMEESNLVALLDYPHL